MYYEYDTGYTFYSIKICLVAPCDRYIKLHLPFHYSAYLDKEKSRIWGFEIQELQVLVCAYLTRRKILKIPKLKEILRDLKMLHHSGTNVRVQTVPRLIPFLQPTLHPLATLLSTRNEVQTL